jgi:hypothetical protein
MDLPSRMSQFKEAMTTKLHAEEALQKFVQKPVKPVNKDQIQDSFINGPTRHDLAEEQLESCHKTLLEIIMDTPYM